jgi:hypothetical protein
MVDLQVQLLKVVFNFTLFELSRIFYEGRQYPKNGGLHNVNDKLSPQLWAYIVLKGTNNKAFIIIRNCNMAKNLKKQHDSL